jgi:acetyl-CoA carboxylase biotin carboxyl carrier protein
VIGIIEVMKLMNSLNAGVKGTVRQVLAEDSRPVGYGQVLMLIEPDT